MKLENIISKGAKRLMPLALTSLLTVSCDQLPLGSEKEEVKNDTLIFDMGSTSNNLLYEELYELDLFARDNEGIEDFVLIRKIVDYDFFEGKIKIKNDTMMDDRNHKKSSEYKTNFTILPHEGLLSFILGIKNGQGVIKRSEIPYTTSTNIKFKQFNPSIKPCERGELVDWETLDELAKRAYVKEIVQKDSTDKNPYIVDEYVCHNFATDFLNNCTSCEDKNSFNVPMYYVALWDSQTGARGHAINGILVGDDPSKLDDWMFIEPQNDYYWKFKSESSNYRQIGISTKVNLRDFDYGHYAVIFNMDSKTPYDAAYVHPFLTKSNSLEKLAKED